jgi:hypothetical protein
MPKIGVNTAIMNNAFDCGLWGLPWTKSIKVSSVTFITPIAIAMKTANHRRLRP